MRLGASLGIGLAGVLLSASCAAGQHAQTAAVVPAIDGTHGKIGNIQLQGVAIHAPSGASYAADSNAQLAVTLVNTGAKSDTLVNVTSSEFAGWGIVDNAQASSSTASNSGDTGLTIDPHSAQRLGLADLGGATDLSPRTLILEQLKSGPLYPGTTVDVTFRFANAGSTTLHVPVQLSSSPPTASLPAPTGPSVD